jgi:protoheme IX farnesyltransferase
MRSEAAHRRWRVRSQAIWHKLRGYWSLLKSLQTALLVMSGLAGYMSAGLANASIASVLAVVGSLFLAVSGSTILNMWYDRDIDALMQRTCWRPLPQGTMPPRRALAVGLAFSALGMGWSFALAPLYGAIVLAGFFFDVVVYTLWLKRRTPLSILWGGMAGGMPVLAGRVLAVGRIDALGVLLAFSVLFWIPTHILTFNMRHLQDYRAAGVPTLPSRFGLPATRGVIASSSLLAVLVMAFALHAVAATMAPLLVGGVVSLGLLGLAAASLLRPSPRLDFTLFKYASLYMLATMILVTVSSP